jgi:hypothetical protein
MTRKGNRKRRDKRRSRNQEKRQQRLTLPTGGGPFANRERLAFRTRKGEAVNDLLQFEFTGVTVPTNEGDPTEGVRERAVVQQHLLSNLSSDEPN